MNKQYAILYENLQASEGSDKYLSQVSPPKFSINPKEAILFDFVSEASMLFELEEYSKCDDNHREGIVMQRIERIMFKEIV